MLERLTHAEPRYLAGICESCGAEYRTDDPTQRGVNVHLGNCARCFSDFCEECRKGCDLCNLAICAKCRQNCATCNEATCTNCMADDGNCSSCRLDAIAAANQRAYTTLRNGTWFCLAAAMLGCVAGLIWLWIQQGGK